MDERIQIANRQGWNEHTMFHLMEYFIESEGLGEEFDKYLQETADNENRQSTEDNAE